MISTYKALSILLSYPTQEIRDTLPEIIPAIKRETLLSEKIIPGLSEFISFFSAMELISWQEHYVQLFDTSGQVSLYLFEHVHGDSKDRGQAMVDLISVYNSHGFDMDRSELPDYLPVFLEFLSMLPPEKAEEYLAETHNILEAVYNRLIKSNNPYLHVLAAVLNIHTTVIINP